MDTQRMKAAMEAKGLSQSALARQLGLSQGAIAQMLNGTTTRSKHLPEIAQALGVSVDWLLGNDISPAVPVKVNDVDFVQIPELDIGFGMGGGTFMEGMPGEEPRVFDPNWLREITRSPAEKLFVARGIGDSMMPTLLDNDTLIVDRGQRMIHQQDRIWAISYGELGMIKRVRRKPDGNYLLMSDNSAISDVDATPDELFVVGRVVWVGRKT